MKLKTPLAIVCGAVVAALSTTAPAQFFSDNFDVDHTANWTVNTAGTGSDANFFFDYSTVGIPSAPNSGGSTLGLRLRANQNGSTPTFPGGVSVSPNGQSFTGNHILWFDMWLNFNGPAPGGGSGSTQITGAGVRTAGTSAQIAGQGTLDSIFFGASGEGGSSIDYRAYAPVATSGLTPADGVFAAGTHSTARQNSDPYYAGFGGVSAPAAQVALFTQQTGTTAAGALGWGWHDVQIAQIGTAVTLRIDGLLIAMGDTTVAGALGGGNILFNQYDINSTVSTEATSQNLLFGLIDNVRVVPEPTTAVLGLLGGLGILMVVRRRK